MVGDFNINDHLQRMRFGEGSGGSGGASKAPDDGVNEKNIGDKLVESAETASGNVGKLLGLNLTSWGQVSLSKAIGGDTDGIAGKNIPSMFNSLNANGGFLANLMHAIFVKNREINDHTQGVGGSGGLIDAPITGGADLSSLIGGGQGSMGNFAWADVPSIPEGGFRPSDTGPGIGAGMAIS